MKFSTHTGAPRIHGELLKLFALLYAFVIVGLDRRTLVWGA
jgi:hypothetical protein